MLDILQFYSWTLFCGAVVAGALAVAGVHLAAQDRSLTALCQSQGAELALLWALGLAFAQGYSLAEVPLWFSLSGSLFGAGLATLLSLVVSVRVKTVRSTHLLSVFLLLVSLSYLTIASHPLLESHFARGFQGDPATISVADSMWMTLFGVFLLVLFMLRHRQFLALSFNRHVLLRDSHSLDRVLFEAGALFLTALSTQFLGFLFTAGLLFLPTVSGAFWAGKSSRSHIICCLVSAVLGAVLGMLASLTLSWLPTAPAVLILTALISIPLHWANSSGKSAKTP